METLNSMTAIAWIATKFWQRVAGNVLVPTRSGRCLWFVKTPSDSELLDPQRVLGLVPCGYKSQNLGLCTLPSCRPENPLRRSNWYIQERSSAADFE